MPDFTVPGILLPPDTHANRPAANAVAVGAIFPCTDHDKLYQSDGSVWSDWLSAAGVGDILDLTTAETDDTLVLAPDGAGGVEFRAEAGGSSALVGARGTRSTNQTITTGTWTGVAMTVADTFDTDAFHDPGGANPSRFVVPSGKDGTYKVSVHAVFAAEATGDRYLAIYKNGAQYGFAMREQANGTIGNFLHICDDVALVATDYVECMVHQDAGGDRTITVARLSLVRVGT